MGKHPTGLFTDLQRFFVCSLGCQRPHHAVLVVVPSKAKEKAAAQRRERKHAAKARQNDRVLKTPVHDLHATDGFVAGHD